MKKKSALLLITSIFILSFAGAYGLKANASDSKTQTQIASNSSNGNLHIAGDKKEVKNGFDKMPKAGTEAYCPVMKHTFKINRNSPKSVYKGKTYVFCCPGCKPQFDKDPQKYIKNL